MQDCRSQNAQVEYEGRTCNTRILESRPLIQSGGWVLIMTHLCPQFWRSKKNPISTQFIELYFEVSEQINSRVQMTCTGWSPCQPVQVIWQSLPKAIPEDNRRFWLKNQWPSIAAQLGLVRWASTNTGCFLVCCSRCWPQLARLRKMCYHCCNTDSVRQSTRFWI